MPNFYMSGLLSIPTQLLFWMYVLKSKQYYHSSDYVRRMRIWAWSYHIVHGFCLPHNKPIMILSSHKILRFTLWDFVCFCVLSRQIPGIWLWACEERGTLWAVWTSRLQFEEYHCTHIIALRHRRLNCQSWGELGVSL